VEHRKCEVSIGRLPDYDRVIVTSNRQYLQDILAPGVLAVIVTALGKPAWIEELTALVMTAKFVIPRTIYPDATIDKTATSVTTMFKDSPLSSGVRDALCEDLIGLVSCCADLTGAARFRLRFFTDVPNCRCSYHVDAVPPRAPTTALVRVYCGACTEYVTPSNLTCWEDFYSYVYMRKRELDAIAVARERVDLTAEARAAARLARLDERPPFLSRPIAPERVPPDSLVACKFVDSRDLWGGTHVRARSAHGWIHRSPMVGEPRFVATVNASA
jgi:hypothetical protein